MMESPLKTSDHSSDSEEIVNHSAADKVSEATQLASRGSARRRYVRVSNGRAPRKQLCTRYRQMRDQRQSNGIPLVPYQSSSESDSDDTDIQIPPSILDLEMEMRSESSDNVEIPVSLSNSPVHQSGKEHVAECRCHDQKHFVSKSTQTTENLCQRSISRL